MVINRCFGCMELTEKEPCPMCGYTSGSQKLPYALRPGTILKGKYLIGKLLGQGGFGLTYIGWDLGLNRKVAIKEYYPSGHASRQVTGGTVVWYAGEAAQTARVNGREMFLKEARKMSKVSNIEQVVRIYDLFQENDTAYICMAFAEGRTLKDHLQKSGTMSWTEVKRFFVPVLEAMTKVHEAGLIHRDVSPDNLMVQPDGGVKILDLGAAKDLKLNSGISSMQVAKSGFSPLEQYVQRGRSGSWTDVYAMAATIYYALTGRVPPTAVDRIDYDRLDWNLPQLQMVPPKALDALKRAMAIRIENRIQTMSELADALWVENGENTETMIQGTSGTGFSKLLDERKNWLVLGVIAATVVLLCIIVGVAFYSESYGKEPGVPDAGNYSIEHNSIADFQQEMSDIIVTCEMETYDYKNGSRMEMYFNQQGRECLRIFVNALGQDEFVFIARYDENGKIMKQYGFENQQLMRESTWDRNVDGKVTRITIGSLEQGLISDLKISYDSQGREVSRYEKDGKGNVLLDAVSTYDAKGNETYSGTDQEGNHFIYEFDSDGRNQSCVFKDDSGRQRFRFEYEYDDSADKVVSYQYDENDELTSWTEEFYSDGREIKSINHQLGIDGEESIFETEYVYGPRDILFGYMQKSEFGEDLWEDVRSIVDSITLRSFGENIDQSYQIRYYNWAGYCTLDEQYRASGELEREIQSFYDESGMETGTIFKTYEEDGGYSISEYDGDFHHVSWRQYDASGKLTDETQYLYDGDGNDIGHVSTRYNEDGSYTVTEWSADYDIISKKTYDASGNLIRTE